MDVTSTPQCLRRTPRLLATTPFPIPEMTPPVTRIYFISFIFCNIVRLLTVRVL